MEIPDAVIGLVNAAKVLESKFTTNPAEVEELILKFQEAEKALNKAIDARIESRLHSRFNRINDRITRLSTKT